MQPDTSDLLTRLVRHYRACEMWQFYATLHEAEGLMGEIERENREWSKAANKALEAAQHAEPFPLPDMVERDGAGEPDEPSDLEPGELPGGDDSTCEARVTPGAATTLPDLDPPDWLADIANHHAENARKARLYDRIKQIVFSEAGS